MTMISSYFAQVGVGIDKSSVNTVSAYLGKIEKQMMSFQKRIGKTGYIDIKVRVDAARAGMALQRSLNTISRTASLNLKNINISAPQMTKALNQSLNRPGQATRIRMGALLSQSSLSDMRNQIRASINSLVVSPRINPRVSAATSTARAARASNSGGGSGLQSLSPFSGRHSPWHNPMMIGGGVGAAIRYGVYSLPMVAGAMGLNALTNSTEETQNAYMGMRAMIGDPVEAESQIRGIENIATKHGVTFKDIAPGYAQIYASAKGTELGDNLENGFLQFMQYASVKGLNSENKKGAVLALSQIAGKDFKAASEEINKQLVNNGIPEARRLFADALGVTEQEFIKNIADGKYNRNDLIKVFDEMGKRAKPYLEEFYKSVTKAKGDIKRNNEVFLKGFMEGGGSGGITAFFRAWNKNLQESIPYAETLGRIFKNTVHYFNAAMLAPGEIVSWFKGSAEEGNFMSHLFGDSKDSEVIRSAKRVVDEVKALFESLIPVIGLSAESMNKELSYVLKTISFIFDRVADTIGILVGYNEGGISGGGHALRKAIQRGVVGSEERQKAVAEGEFLGKEVPEQEVFRRIDAAMAKWLLDNPAPKMESTLSDKLTSAWNPFTGFFPSPSTIFGSGSENPMAKPPNGWLPLNTLNPGSDGSIVQPPQGGWLPLNTLNSGGAAPQNTPQVPSLLSEMGQTVTVIHHIKQDPLTVNATVDSRTDADAIVMEIERRTEEASKQVWGSLLSNYPVVTK